MLSPDPVEVRLDRELTHLLDHVHAATAHCPHGRWPADHLRGIERSLISVSRSALHLVTLLHELTEERTRPS